jgi:hypothetical protein
MELTFDKAIELLEITNISKIKIEDLPQLEKKLKKRWHPDRVSHLNDPAITEEYTVKFQQIELACQMVYSYLSGTYHAGDAFTQTKKNTHEEPEEIIRKNAPEMQQTLESVWNLVKEKKYKWSEQEMILSDGFKLKDLLHEDFKEDIAMLSVVSFFYGLVFLGILTAIGFAINPAIGTIVSIVLLLHVIACALGFAPLSRFWLPVPVSEVMIRFINFGLGIYHWAEDQAQNSSKSWVVLLIRIPVLFAKLIKYLILLPLTELAKVFVGNKIVGVVKQKVNYYAEAADWYIEQLINSHPDDMSSEELFHLSYIYSELSDVKAKTWEPVTSENTFTTENKTREEATDKAEVKPGQTYASATGTMHEDKSETDANEFKDESQQQADANPEEINPVFVDIPEPENKMTTDAAPLKTVEPVQQEERSYLPETQEETSYQYDKKKKKKNIALAAAILIFTCGIGAIFLFSNLFKIAEGSSAVNKNIPQDSTIVVKEIAADTSVSPANADSQASQPEQVVPIPVKDNVSAAPDLKAKEPEKINTVAEPGVYTDKIQQNGFVFLSKAQVLNSLLNKPLCEGMVYTGPGQKIIFTSAFPGKEYQQAMGLYGTIRINIILEDELTGKSCRVEIIYKKDKSGFEMENYAQK